MHSPIKIIVVDDHALFRKGLIETLKQFEMINIVAEAADGIELFDVLENAEADMLLLDLQMPNMSGFDVLEKLKKDGSPIKCIVISMHMDDVTIAYALEKGAAAFVPKNAYPSEIITAIQGVYDKGFYFSEDVSKALLNRITTRKKNMPLFKTNKMAFSEKEVKVIKLLGQELSNEEIGNQINLSHRTVETIRQHAIKKAGVRNVVGLVLLAAKCGIIEL